MPISIEIKKDLRRNWKRRIADILLPGCSLRRVWLCQKNLYGDGIFDRNWNSYTPVELEMPLDMNDPMIKETLSVLENYKKEVEAKM